MVRLTLAGCSKDGNRLLLVSSDGTEFTLEVDDSLRAALRGDLSRIGQLEIQMDSVLRPRDIQARIRAGETPEQVAEAARCPVEQIMPYAGPVLAERAHIADRAQRSSLRRTHEHREPSGRTLADAVGAVLRPLNVAPDRIEWDAWKREDGRWTLVCDYRTPARNGSAEFVFDVPGNYVSPVNRDAQWLTGDLAEEPEPAPPAPTPLRHLGVVGSTDPTPADSSGRDERTESPADGVHPDRGHQERGSQDQGPQNAGPRDLGEDALQLVRDAEETWESQMPLDAFFADDDEDDDDRVDDQANDRADDQADDGDATEAASGRAATSHDKADQPSAEAEPETDPEDGSDPNAPARREVRKNRGRASVPSWDEIMFGGGQD